jgi:DNA-binding transcriptional ArsR family regulator
MLDLDVIDDPAAATAALDPVRARLLAALSQPMSAAALAAQVGMPRQRVGYYLKALVAHGLVRPAGARRWGGLTEQRLVATARAYAVSDAALGPLAPAAPGAAADRASASYLIALAARAVREVGALWRRARAEEVRLPTLALDTTIAFRSPAERAAFADDLLAAVTSLAGRYHSDDPAARPHRLVALLHPVPEETT